MALIEVVSHRCHFSDLVWFSVSKPLLCFSSLHKVHAPNVPHVCRQRRCWLQLPSSSFQIHRKKVLLSQSADGGVTVPHVNHLYISSAKDLLRKRVQRCRSLLSVALRSFLVVRKSPETLHDLSCCCSHVLLPMVGNAVKAGYEVKFLISKNYSWKIYYLQILLINVYQL